MKLRKQFVVPIATLTLSIGLAFFPRTSAADWNEIDLIPVPGAQYGDPDSPGPTKLAVSALGWFVLARIHPDLAVSLLRSQAGNHGTPVLRSRGARTSR